MLDYENNSDVIEKLVNISEKIEEELVAKKNCELLQERIQHLLKDDDEIEAYGIRAMMPARFKPPRVLRDKDDNGVELDD
jgi:hypothetical protein